MNGTFEKLIRHFHSSNQTNIFAAGNAFLDGNINSLKKIVDHVSQLELTASISTLINSSTVATRDFIGEIELIFDPQAIKFIFGGILLGIGGAALAEAAGLAIAVGISVFSIQIVAIVLLMWGLSITLPIVFKNALMKMRELKDGIDFY